VKRIPPTVLLYRLIVNEKSKQYSYQASFTLS
jgi:hypothetical protein